MLRTALLTTCLFAAASVASAADLRVQVTGLRANTGAVGAMLIDSDAAWNGKGAPVAATGAPVGDSDAVELVFADLKPGHYALRLMHDANGNGKLDTNPVGMPVEGYGFSNNPQVMRAATFEEARFEVVAAGTAITIEMR